MSNVLIGIIGVILFIGLALSGALFLGPKFQEAVVQNRASTVISNLSQITTAMTLQRLDSGSTTSCRSLDYLVPGYLKSIPVNPMPAARMAPTGYYFFTPQMNSDLHAEDQSEMSSCTGVVSYVITGLGPDEEARKVCEQIERNYGGTLLRTATPTRDVGCIHHPTTNRSVYTAYMKL